MEGLLIHEVLTKIVQQLPSQRQSWRFPDAHSAVLPISRGSIWFSYRPPHPAIQWKDEHPSVAKRYTGFQDLLQAQVVGDLVAVEQLKLDRVVIFRFAASQGFVNSQEVSLIAELTGRNCNLVVVDKENIIMGAAKEIRSDINRFRQLYKGLPYVAPPPYDKLDPRRLSLEQLQQAMTGKKLKQLRQVVDGFGPELSRTLAVMSAVPSDAPLDASVLERVYQAMQDIVASPDYYRQQALGQGDAEEKRREAEIASLREQLRTHYSNEKKLIHKRLKDVERLRQAADESERMRQQADLLMAYQYQIPRGTEVELTGFDGSVVQIPLDPRLDALENAQRLYDRIKKREKRKSQAEGREQSLLRNLGEVNEALTNLEHQDVEAIKEKLAAFKASTSRPQKQIGKRYQSPQGFTVIVGRNAKENAHITFRIARSQDIWLHVQAYTGSHVIIQAAKKEVPFETILFAAQLAAAHSKASESDNVAVDYAFKKHVWKAKGAAPGAVHFSQQKTVYVTPSRQPSGDK